MNNVVDRLKEEIAEMSDENLTVTVSRKDLMLLIDLYEKALKDYKR